MSMTVGTNGFLYVKDFALFEEETKKIKAQTEKLLSIAQDYKKSFSEITKDWVGTDARAFEVALDDKIRKLKHIQQVCEKLADTAKSNADYERQAQNDGFRMGIGI